MIRKSFAITLLCSLLLSAGIEVQAHPCFYEQAIPTEREIEHYEKKLIKLINDERTKHGLKALKEWSVVSKQAKEHSINMAKGKVKFGHDGFHQRSQEIMSASKHVRTVGENVAYNYGKKDRLRSAVEGWMNSPGHRKNILGDYDETGVGIAFSNKGYCYLTQMFSKKSY